MLFPYSLKDLKLDEGQPAHFETTLTPVNDASMTVEWLFNGKPIPQGHRFRTTYDFGFVALDILYAYPEDSGTYTCHAANQMGETTATSNLVVQGKSGLMLDTMDRDRLRQFYCIFIVFLLQSLQYYIFIVFFGRVDLLLHFTKVKCDSWT